MSSTMTCTVSGCTGRYQRGHQLRFPMTQVKGRLYVGGRMRTARVRMLCQFLCRAYQLLRAYTYLS